MTERKPRDMSYTSWIDQQILDAEKRGVFDNLPGAGKPLDLKPDDGADYGAAWVRDYARREGVSPEDFLPTPLKLRREAERLAESVPDMRASMVNVAQHVCTASSKTNCPNGEERSARCIRHRAGDKLRQNHT